MRGRFVCSPAMNPLLEDAPGVPTVEEIRNMSPEQLRRALSLPPETDIEMLMQGTELQAGVDAFVATLDAMMFPNDPPFDPFPLRHTTGAAKPPGAPR